MGRLHLQMFPQGGVAGVGLGVLAYGIGRQVSLGGCSDAGFACLEEDRVARQRSLGLALGAVMVAGGATLIVLDLPLQDVYPADHWALAGTPPGYDTPDQDATEQQAPGPDAPEQDTGSESGTETGSPGSGAPDALGEAMQRLDEADPGDTDEVLAAGNQAHEELQNRLRDSES